MHVWNACLPTAVVTFMHAVGAQTLLAWDAQLAKAALQTYQQVRPCVCVWGGKLGRSGEKWAA